MEIDEPLPKDVGQVTRLAACGGSRKFQVIAAQSFRRKCCEEVLCVSSESCGISTHT